MSWLRKLRNSVWGIDRMSSHFTVVYDACVLYPAPLRDLLMHLALSDMYRARWSDMIHDEWTRHVLANRPDLTPDQLKRTRQLMNAHVRDSLVTGFEYLIPSINLPDPDDRHVVAAALHSGASLVVTFNLKDCRARKIGGCAMQELNCLKRWGCSNPCIRARVSMIPISFGKLQNFLSAQPVRWTDSH